jgi:hypothetical protein
MNKGQRIKSGSLFLVVTLLISGCTKNDDWKFPANGVPSKQVNGMTIYDLGDGFQGSHTQSPKKGHMVSIGVPSSIYEKTVESTSDEKEISKIIAWEAFRRACYPRYDNLSDDYIGTTGNEILPVHAFRTSNGDTMNVIVLVGNDNLFNGSMAMISKERGDDQ